MSDKYTAEQARQALDSLDDCARMSVGVDANGPRKVLEAFIEQAAQMMREREVGGAVTEALPGVVWSDKDGACLVKRETEDDFCKRWNARRVYAARRAAVPDAMLDHFCNAIDNLNDLPINEKWAARWCEKAIRLLAAAPEVME